MNLLIIRSKLIALTVILLTLISCEKNIKINKFLIVSHQGYWKASEGAQNSIRALLETVRLNIEGVELDVRITTDNHLILHHDSRAGDYIIENSKLTDIRTLILSDGSCIPTLDEYFVVAQEYKDLQLYIDIKTQESIKPVINKIIEYNLSDRVILLTTYDIGLAVISNNTNIKIHCLSNSHPLRIKESGFSGIAYSINFIKQHPAWIYLAQNIGLTVGTWVIKSESEIIWCSQNNIEYVITDSPLECKHYLYQ